MNSIMAGLLSGFFASLVVLSIQVMRLQSDNNRIKKEVDDLQVKVSLLAMDVKDLYKKHGIDLEDENEGKQ